jgi:6-pyruvoyltetrahydropterin/6-carboxytetrahydropterin synthase
MKTCRKRYVDYPFAHRAPMHDGHCKLLHGHNWTFDIVFAADECDENGFVIDFGKLGELKASLDVYFDHTLLINLNDPLRVHIEDLLKTHEIFNLVPVLDCSCEGIAQLVAWIAEPIVRKLTDDRVRVCEVTVYEDTKNSATYRP